MHTETSLQSDLFGDEPRTIERGTEPAIVDLNRLLLEHPNQTRFCRMTGDSMAALGIHDGDVLLVDQRAVPGHGDIVLARLDDVVMCRQLDLHHRLLRSAHTPAEETPIRPGSDFEILGVVTRSVRMHRACDN